MFYLPIIEHNGLDTE